MRAEDYRWDFLAYCNQDNPFSKPLSVRYARRVYLRSMKAVKAFCDSGMPLGYSALDRLFLGLDSEEKLRLTDCIIKSYNCVDYDVFLSLYQDYGQMKNALWSAAGREYDIDEYNEPWTYPGI